MTEKDYNPERENKKVLVNTEPKKQQITSQPQKKEKIAETKVSEDKNIINEENAQYMPDKKISEPTGEAKISEAKPSEEKKKPIQKKPIVKKTEAVVRGVSLPISMKTSSAICRFIKHKKIKDAIADLEKVLAKKKAVPMRGEIPHRKGKIMAGRFPQKASKHFIELLKTLSANANVSGLENPIVVEAFANKASEPYGKSGRVQKKRTHIKIKCMEKMIKGNKEDEK